jgi:2-(1,2-epoxy-1,2-dihydrophenyl)acetyl-CoA isomerase
MDEILIERRDRVLHVAINRPERKNAMSVPLWEELARLLLDFSSNTDDRVMVLTGTNGVFCAGGDISGMASSERGPEPGDAGVRRMRGTVTAVCLGVHQAPKPIIAAVDGIAAGAGANLALGCDLVLASERARFSEIFIRRGLSMDSGGSWLLPRLVGLQKAKELAFFGEWIEAEEARQIGLVNKVVPTEQLLDEAHGWATRLAEMAPAALALIKQGLNRSFETPFAQTLDDEASWLAFCSNTPEAREAIRAFFDKQEKTP